MSKVKLISMAVIAVLVAIVLIQNRQPVDTQLLFFKFTMSRAVLLLTTLIVGFVLGLLTVTLAKRPQKAP